MCPTVLLLILFLCARYGQGKQPHIVFMLADDLGWNDIGYHNPQIISPNIDRLAHRGVKLESSYVQPACTPSRAAIMTGIYPYHLGLQHHVIHYNMPNYLPLNLTILPEELKKLGYSTHIIGKWHLGFCNWSYTPTYRGFDSFVGFYGALQDYFTHSKGNGYDFRKDTEAYFEKKGQYSSHVFAERAVEIISQTDPNDKPLFLYIPFQSPHGPLSVPKKYVEMNSHIRDPQRRLYAGVITAMDEAVGNITDALERYGFLENLLLVFITDNGGMLKNEGNNLPLRGAKGTLWEGGTRGVTFAYSKTLLQKTGYKNNQLIHIVDWYPTLLYLAGGTEDPRIDGKNVWAAISRNYTSPRKEFVYNIDDMLDNAAIRVGQYKLIEGIPGHRNEWYRLPTRRRWKKRGRRQTEPVYQMFNIKDDPNETENLAPLFSNRFKLMRLKERLEYYKQSLVPARFPEVTEAGDPSNFNNVWSPGWC